MWGNFIKNCGRFLITVPPFIKPLNCFHFKQRKTLLNICFINQTQQRLLVCPSSLRNTETVRTGPPAVSESDVEYIVPYKIEYEKHDTNKMIIQTLRTKFHLNKEEIEMIISNQTVSKICREKSLMETLDLLCLESVEKGYFIEYPWLITLDRKRLLEKLNLLKSLNGFRNINEFVPFLRIHLPRLRKLIFLLNREANQLEHGNRIYYLAEKLKVSPATVTKYLANRLFVLEMPLEMFKTNLQHMINYNVESMNILKDLWGFRYAPKAIELRLKRALQAKKDKIMPWMVRCPEPILQKSLQLSLDELQVLGDKANVAEYVGERLGFSTEEAKAIMNRHPQVNGVRVTKIKEVLDYLLDEAKFTRHEVAQVPRVLCHSLETTKERIEELKKYGCRPSSLVIVCRSKREYEKFLSQWLQNYECNKDNERIAKEGENE